jgi:hypothetical protein
MNAETKFRDLKFFNHREVRYDGNGNALAPGKGERFCEWVLLGRRHEGTHMPAPSVECGSIPFDFECKYFYAYNEVALIAGTNEDTR